MNAFLILADFASRPAPLMLKIIFWILLILWAIGSFGWAENPRWVRGSSILLIVLFSILGLYTFGF